MCVMPEHAACKLSETPGAKSASTTCHDATEKWELKHIFITFACASHEWSFTS